MTRTSIRTLSALSLLTALAAFGTAAQAEQVQARVITSSPVTNSNGNIRYNVVYEYAGRQYNTTVANPPGASIWVDSTAYGLATPSPVAPQPQIATAPVDAPQQMQQMQPMPQQSWQNVVPEPGVVVSGGGAPVYAQPAQVYTPPPAVYAPAPVYVQPAPVYYSAPAYYPQPAYAFPPIGISLGFGYSRGWR
ncbi:hypothetical protein QTH87_04575 [Variovorax sp. J22P168]|uniref:hypothetical protein n=1 Tax=Variovorax jilinensis TaxID=3053513 RepID=UPI002574E622|nr:hypothetical protein [Variovorax sp. J22P168]MDM0011709.1 hypothetical protein [Variovorax sp. J22P168]